MEIYGDRNRWIEIKVHSATNFKIQITITSLKMNKI